ncbi:MAG: YegS/Rv2252/BmrU family lipid kinase [Bacillota bacterium]|nr:YegS/Rv2252/BmrU family lipid kinase [Bacillota bacterium]
MKLKFIYNPKAGRGKILRWLSRIEYRFKKAGAELEVFCLDGKADMQDFITKTPVDYDGIVVAGGDGTVNRVINCMIKNDVVTPLGILPTGTANGFSRFMRGKHHILKAVDVILENRVVMTDLGCVNGTYFINVCSAGVFTDVSQKVDINLKNKVGSLAYVFAGIKDLKEFSPITLSVNGEIVEALFFLVFNGRGVAVLDKLADKASIRDGLLDAVVVKKCNFLRRIRVFTKMVFGKHFGDSAVMFKQCDHIIIKKLNGTCSLPDVDGEPAPEFPLDIICEKRKMPIFM